MRKTLTTIVVVVSAGSLAACKMPWDKEQAPAPPPVATNAETPAPTGGTEMAKAPGETASTDPAKPSPETPQAPSTPATR